MDAFNRALRVVGAQRGFDPVTNRVALAFATRDQLYPLGLCVIGACIFEQSQKLMTVVGDDAHDGGVGFTHDDCFAISACSCATRIVAGG